MAGSNAAFHRNTQAINHYQRYQHMARRYKVTGIDPGNTAFSLGECLTIRQSADVANTPRMYAESRSEAMGWMNATTHTLHNRSFLDELFKSDVVLDEEASEAHQPGAGLESPLLIAALLIAFPDARFGVGLAGDESSLAAGQDYRSIGKHSIPLRDGSAERSALVRLFNYLGNNSYWIDDDLVHMLALLCALCRDRDRVTPEQVLGLSISGNHQVDAGVFHAYQLLEALLGRGPREAWRKAVARWNDTHDFQLHTDAVEFIRNLRDVSLHFKATRAERCLKKSRVALSFDQDHQRETDFRQYCIQRLLREATRAYILHRLGGEVPSARPKDLMRPSGGGASTPGPASDQK